VVASGNHFTTKPFRTQSVQPIFIIPDFAVLTSEGFPGLGEPINQLLHGFSDKNP